MTTFRNLQATFPKWYWIFKTNIFNFRLLLTNYGNFVVIGDFNLPVENSHLEAIIQAYDLSSLKKKPTCYQSHTPSCNDLILTNRKHLFQLSNAFKTGLSDHHKRICSILKSGGFKGAPIKKYIDPMKHSMLISSKRSWKLN